MSIPNLLSSNLSNRLRVLSRQEFECKAFLPVKSDCILKIEQGVVRTLTWDEEGRTMTLGFWGKGEIVGQPLSRMKPYQIECLTPVQVSELLSESPYLQDALLVHAWKSEELLSIIHHSCVLKRLWCLLEWLSLQFGQNTPNGRSLNLRLTHQTIAETIGTSRVTVTRLINQLERAGKLQRLCKLEPLRKPQQLERFIGAGSKRWHCDQNLIFLLL
jgi:CRP-like cAMP-binding protein